jgi:hypothetical protein
MSSTCPNCGVFLPTVPLPVSPLFSREEVCALVPVKLSTLRKWLTTNKHRLEPARYMGPIRRGKRMFTAEEIRMIRSSLLRSRQ